MAKFEKRFVGDFDELLVWLNNDITKGSVTATYDDGGNYTFDEIRLAVRIYERNSLVGKNRLNLNVTLLGKGGELFVSAIASGGNLAKLIKINRWGEGAFLELCISSIERYISAKQSSLLLNEDGKL